MPLRTYALRPAPYPYTPHPTPCALHHTPTPLTLRPTPYILPLYPSPYALIPPVPRRGLQDVGLLPTEPQRRGKGMYRSWFLWSKEGGDCAGTARALPCFG